MNQTLISKINNKFYYGWLIIGIAALSVFFSAPGQTYSISTFIDVYIEDFGFSRTLISSIYSFATILSGMLLVFMGKAVDKFGQRRMTLVVGFLFAVTCFFNSMITNIFMIAIGFFFLRYFGQGSLTLIPGSLTPQWFEKKRALSFSLMNLGGVLANLTVPIFNVWMITQFSWQTAWRFWSILIVVIFLPLVYIFIVNKPEDIGLLPDNRKITKTETLDDEINRMEKESWTLNQALKTKEFWFVGIISMIVPMISTGLMFHFFSIMSLKGLSEAQAAMIIGLIALPGFIMPIVSNLVLDRFRSKYIISVTLLMISASLLLLLSVNNIYTAIAFMLFYGLAINIQGVTINVIWPRYFGRKYLGSIRGAATIFMVIGSALGPLPFGLSFDLAKSYNPVLLILVIICVLSILLSLSIRKPTKIKEDRA